MTSAAMIAGMIPLALGFMKGGDQTAPLGVAVIGGLLFSTLSVLFFLPPAYHWTVGKSSYKSLSLDPDDINSKNYDHS
jgi:multidrug efflux pump subunit AcrB